MFITSRSSLRLLENYCMLPLLIVCYVFSFLLISISYHSALFMIWFGFSLSVVLSFFVCRFPPSVRPALLPTPLAPTTSPPPTAILLQQCSTIWTLCGAMAQQVTSLRMFPLTTYVI